MNPKLTTCKACGGVVAISAPRCPHCGDVRGRWEQIPKQSKRGLKLLLGLIGAIVVGGLIVAAIEHQEDHDTSAGLEIGKTYDVLSSRVCARAVDRELSDDAWKAQGRVGDPMGCGEVTAGVDRAVILEKHGALVKVRLIINPVYGSSAKSPFEFAAGAWLRAEDIKPAS